MKKTISLITSFNSSNAIKKAIIKAKLTRVLYENCYYGKNITCYLREALNTAKTIRVLFDFPSFLDGVANRSILKTASNKLLLSV